MVTQLPISSWVCVKNKNKKKLNNEYWNQVVRLICVPVCYYIILRIVPFFAINVSIGVSVDVPNWS